ncbi:MAG: hypothetical protein QOI20_631 [Acidimicrobiaceae bacterium]|nr:hypothetical protein [Acidimicrobiaceae bacterium]
MADRKPSRWIYELPKVTFDRQWRLGRATFRPPGEAAAEVATFAAQATVHDSWRVAFELATEVAARWVNSSTVDVEADSDEDANSIASESLAALRFFMREIVPVNVEIHRIGLVGEVAHAVREYLGVFEGLERLAVGGSVIDAAVDFRFTTEDLDKWDSDARVSWLSSELALDLESRSIEGRRAITALGLLDRAFLSRDPVVRVILCAVAVEALLADIEDPNAAKPSMTGSLRIASRVAYLTCGTGCAVDRPACPYVLGFKGHKHVWAMAEQWSQAGKEWRCSAFLDIARPPDMETYFRRPSLFGARNEAAHEGRTSLDASDVTWMRVYAEGAVKAFLSWVARTHGTVADLDSEVQAGATRLGLLVPADT